MPHVFMSYSRRDTASVDIIVDRLEKAGINVWIDREDITAGKQWRAQIVEAIETATAFVLGLSPSSAASVNVLKELNLAESASDPFVLPVLLQDVKVPPEMRYQLAGVQHIVYYTDPEKACRELETTLQTRLEKVSRKKVSAQREIEIVLKGKKLSDFDEAKKQQLLDLLADVTGTPVEKLAVTRIELGSFHVFVQAPIETGYAVKALALNRDKRLLQAGVERVRYTGDRNYLHLDRAPAIRPAGFSRPWVWFSSLFFALAVLVIGLVFFNKPPETPATKPATQMFTPTFTETKEKPNITCTRTCTPTPTATIYDGPPKVVATRDAVCREGPGLQYPLGAGDMRSGEEAYVKQTDQTREWVDVWVERLKLTCWVSVSKDGPVNLFGSLDGIPVYEPPTGTPTRTPTRTLTPTRTGMFFIHRGDVSGLVWNDSNGDALPDIGEAVFTDVPVFLWWSDECGKGSHQTTYTNEFGEYDFIKIPIGTYCVEVFPDTFPDPVYAWQSTTGGNTATFVIVPNDNYTLDFGYVDSK